MWSPAHSPLTHRLRQRTQQPVDHTPLRGARSWESTRWGVWRPGLSFWLWCQPAVSSQGAQSLPCLVLNRKQSPHFQQRCYCPPSRHTAVLCLNSGPVRPTAGFSTRFPEPEKWWRHSPNWQPRVLYPAKACLRSERIINNGAETWQERNEPFSLSAEFRDNRSVRTVFPGGREFSKQGRALGQR